MTTFMGQKTKMKLVTDEDCYSTRHLLDRNSQNFRGIFGIFTALHNLYVGYLFHDFSRNTCVSRNPDWKWLFYEMRPHQGVLGNRFPTLRQEIMSSLSTIKWPEEIFFFSLPFEAKQNFDDYAVVPSVKAILFHTTVYSTTRQSDALLWCNLELWSMT